MKLFGLIGYPLEHSFSKRYFTEKFEKKDKCPLRLVRTQTNELFSYAKETS
jgi:shikimate dehydrogenase